MGINLAAYLPNFTSLFSIFAILLLYWYLTKNHDFWKKRGIPYVPPYPLFGTLWENQKLPLAKLELQRYRKYGRIYGYFEADKPVLSVGDPVILRDILAKEFPTFSHRRIYTKADEFMNLSVAHLRGEDWKRVRSIVSPVFTTGKLKKLMSTLEECSRTLADNFKKAAKKGVPVDVKRFYSAFTMDTIASSAFSTKVDSHNNPNNEFVKMAHETFTKDMRWRYYLHILLPRVFNFFKMTAWRPEGIEFFSNVARQLVEERRNGVVSNDFLQLLLDSAEEVEKEEAIEKESSSNSISEETNKNSANNSFLKVISMNEIIAQCVIFFLAGYETTASTLSYITYELALNQDVQELLYREVKKVLEDTNGQITYEALQSMKYMDQVIWESLRLFPPVIRLERVSTSDYTLENPKLLIPKGTLITVPIFSIHRDPEFFPIPEFFDPERFRQEESAKRTQYTFMPFGTGPRNCIAKRFALLEIKICLTHLVSNFKFHRCPKTKVPPEFSIGQRHLIAKHITLKVEERNIA